MLRAAGFDRWIVEEALKSLRHLKLVVVLVNHVQRRQDFLKPCLFIISSCVGEMLHLLPNRPCEGREKVYHAFSGALCKRHLLLVEHDPFPSFAERAGLAVEDWDVVVADDIPSLKRSRAR